MHRLPGGLPPPQTLTPSPSLWLRVFKIPHSWQLEQVCVFFFFFDYSVSWMDWKNLMLWLQKNSKCSRPTMAKWTRIRTVTALLQWCLWRMTSSWSWKMERWVIFFCFVGRIKWIVFKLFFFWSPQLTRHNPKDLSSTWEVKIPECENREGTLLQNVCSSFFDLFCCFKN